MTMYARKILIFFGGCSTEYAVSLESAAAVLANLDPARWAPVPVGITRDGRWFYYTGPLQAIPADTWHRDAGHCAACMLDAARGARTLWLADGRRIRFEAAFPVLHGKNGEDGTVQGLFALAGLPFVGCGVLASAVCMDKAVANTLMDAAGVPHCRWCSAARYELDTDPEGVCARIEAALPYPIFVKPANAGSSVGISKAKDRAGLRAAIATALAEDDKVIFEEFVDGQEVECAAIGNPEDPATVLVTRPGEILAGAEFYTYDDKYKNGVSQVVIPARLSEAKLDEVSAAARRAYLALGCTGLARCDFFVEKGTGRVLCNELNTMPGFTAISMYPKLMEQEGLSFSALADRLIGLALRKRKGAY